MEFNPKFLDDNRDHFGVFKADYWLQISSDRKILVSELLGRTKGIIQLRNGYPGLGYAVKGKQYRGQPVPQQSWLLTPVQLDRTRGKGYKAVVAEAVVAEAVVAIVESKE
jgi:hypothetical protein